MELTKQLIKKILHFNDGFYYYSNSDVDLIDIIGTIGKTGFYINWNIVDHFTGAIHEKMGWTYVPNERIIHRFQMSKWYGLDIKGSRKEKIEYLKLLNELKNEKIILKDKTSK